VGEQPKAKRYCRGERNQREDASTVESHYSQFIGSAKAEGHGVIEKRGRLRAALLFRFTKIA
jgi:hypothetical protein